MDRSELLSDLRAVLDEKARFEAEGPNSDYGVEWLARASVLVTEADPDLGGKFDNLRHYVGAPLSSDMLVPIWSQMTGIIQRAILLTERVPVESSESTAGEPAETGTSPPGRDDATSLDDVTIGAVVGAIRHLSLQAGMALGGLIVGVLVFVFWLGQWYGSGTTRADLGASGTTGVEPSAEVVSLRTALASRDSLIDRMQLENARLPAERLQLDRDGVMTPFLSGRGRITVDGPVYESIGRVEVIVYVDDADTTLTLRFDERADVTLAGYRLFIDLLGFVGNRPHVSVLVADEPSGRAR